MDGPQRTVEQVNPATGALLLAYALLGGCASDARLQALEERTAALDARVAVLEAAGVDGAKSVDGSSVPPEAAPSTDTVRGLEIRLQALEREAMGGAAPSALEVDVETRRVMPKPTESRALDCAYGELGGVVTAEYAHDAAFDGWEADFRKLNHTPSTRDGCDRIVTSRVTVDGADFDAVAVVVAGPARGRWYHAGKDGKVMDGGRMPEAEVVAIEVASKR